MVTDSPLHYDEFFFRSCTLDTKLIVLLWAVFFWPLSFPFYTSIYLSAFVVRVATLALVKSKETRRYITPIFAALILFL